jgi:hypothetical protein
MFDTILYEVDSNDIPLQSVTWSPTEISTEHLGGGVQPALTPTTSPKSVTQFMTFIKHISVFILYLADKPLYD